MSSSLDIRDLIESNRVAMVATGLNEGSVRHALSAIVATESRGLFAIWDAVDEQIGKAETTGLRDGLIELKVRFGEHVATSEISRLEKSLADSPEDAWNAWQIAIAASISHFRHGLSARLASFGLRLPGRADEASALIRAVQRMHQTRWTEAYGQLEKLYERSFLSTEIRARLLCLLGQIQSHFGKFGSARSLLEAADALAPGSVMMISALGDYWIQEGVPDKDPAKAITFYQRALEIAPQSCDGYVGMGAISEQKQELAAAEGWYRKAIAAASGETSGYERLIRLYGGPEFFEQHEAQLLPLTELANAVGSAGEQTRYVELGSMYAQNKQFDKARYWYEKSIALEGSDPGGYVALGAIHEQLGEPKEAEAWYKRAIDAAPDSYDGYWRLTWLYEQQQKWQQALEWYEKAPQYAVQWASLLRTKIGEMYSKLGRRQEAEELLLRELAAEKENDLAKDVLHAISEGYYLSASPDRASTERTLTAMQAILGEPYAAEYHNRLGHLSYHFQEYDRAVAEYRLAIAAKPQVAVYHGNLASAYTSLKHYDEAVAEVKQARAIDGDAETFNTQMALIANTRANDCYERGEYLQAIELYRTAVELNPADEVLHQNLAGAWEQVKDPDKIMDALDQALEVYRGLDRVKPGGQYAADIERLTFRKEMAASYGEQVLDRLNIVTPIIVDVADNLIPLFAGEHSGGLSAEVTERIVDFRAGIERRFGVSVPGIRARAKQPNLPDGTYIIQLLEIPVVSGTVMVEQRYFAGTQQTLGSVGVTGLEAIHPVTGEEGFWIEPADWKPMEDAGHELWAPAKYLFSHLEAVVARNLPDFVGYEEMAQLVESVSPAELVRLRGRAEERTALTNVCQALLAEEVPVAPFAAVYDAFQHFYSPGVALQSIVERIRALPELRSALAGNRQADEVVPFGPQFESELRRALYYSGPHSLLAMDPERCKAAVAALRKALTARNSGYTNTTLVVNDPDLRPFVRRLIEVEFPGVAVLSRRELQEDVKVASTPIELEEDSKPAKPVRSQTSLRASSESVSEVEKRECAIPVGGVRITVRVSGAGSQSQSAADDHYPLETILSMMADGIFDELGLMLPKVKLETDPESEPGIFRFELNGREGPQIHGLEEDEFLVNETVEKLAILGIEGRQAVNPVSGGAGAIVREKADVMQRCRDAGLTVWGPSGFLALTLSAQIRNAAPAFQTAKVTNYILQSLRKVFPELIDTALSRLTVERICLLLRNLLSEEIPIRNIRAILESMLAVDGTTDVDFNRYIVYMPFADSLCPVATNKPLSDLTADDYTAIVRAALNRYISAKYTRGGNTLSVYLLDRNFEIRVSQATDRPLTDEERERFKRSVHDELKQLAATAAPPVVLTTMDVRLPIKKLLAADFPNLPVVSYEELSAEINIAPIARIPWK